MFVYRLMIVEDELISALPMSTHSAVEMFHDSVLYKFMIDIDTDIEHNQNQLWKHLDTQWLVTQRLA